MKVGLVEYLLPTGHSAGCSGDINLFSLPTIL